MAASREDEGAADVQEVTMADFVTALKNTRPSVASGLATGMHAGKAIRQQVEGGWYTV